MKVSIGNEIVLERILCISILLVMILTAPISIATGASPEMAGKGSDRVTSTGLDLTGDLGDPDGVRVEIEVVGRALDGAEHHTTPPDVTAGKGVVISQVSSGDMTLESRIHNKDGVAKQTSILTNNMDSDGIFFVTYVFASAPHSRDDLFALEVGGTILPEEELAPVTSVSPPDGLSPEHSFRGQLPEGPCTGDTGLTGSHVSFILRNGGHTTFDWSDLMSNDISTYEPRTVISSTDEGVTVRVTVSVELGAGEKEVLDPIFDLSNGANVDLYGESAGFETGSCLAHGDLDGDGMEDLLVSAPMGSSMDLGSGEAGRIYVIFGKSQSRYDPHMDLALDADIIIFGEDFEDWAGMALAAGDIDNDGNDDIIVGVPYADGKDNGRRDSGEIDIIWGGGIDQIGAQVDLSVAPDLVIYGKDANDHFGLSVSCLDVDNDGYGDVLVGAPGGDGATNTAMGEGEAYLIPGNTRSALGSERDLATWTIPTLYGEHTGDMLGTTVLLAPLDQDAYADLIVASYTYDSSRGIVYIFWGSASLPATLQANGADVTITGTSQDDMIGKTLSRGNIDADSYTDLVIAAPGADGKLDSDPNSGEVYVFWGKLRAAWPTDVTPASADIVLYGKDANDHVGTALDCGDIDMDGDDDIMVGAPNVDAAYNTRDDAGEIYVVLGNTRANMGTSIDLWPDSNTTFYGASRDDRAGTAVALADMDGDGKADMVIGHPGSDGRYDDMDGAGGASIRFSGGGMDVVIYGIDPMDRTGYGVASGDMDNDGHDDLLIVAPGTSGLYGVYGDDREALGSILDLSSDADFQSTGNDAFGTPYGSSLFGASIAVGDLNNDGFDDVAVGAPRYSEYKHLYRGAVFIWMGGPRGTMGGPDITLKGAKTSFFGSAVAIGNIDGSGGDELIVGAPHDSSQGKVFVYTSGNSLVATIVGKERWMIGRSLATGDIDGDGYDDILIGAPQARISAISRAGAVAVIKGGSSISSNIELSTDSDLMLMGARMNLMLGWDVKVADLDNDSYGDIVASTPYGKGPSCLRDECGDVYVMYGTSSLLDGTNYTMGQDQDLVIYGPRDGDRAGTALAVGDTNGDGYDDLIVGAPLSDGRDGELMDCGGAFILQGGTRATLGIQKDLDSTISYYGTDSMDSFASSLYTGNIDGDGYDDIIAGAPHGCGPRNSRSSTGDSYIIYGCDHSPPVLDIDGLHLLNGGSTVSTRAFDQRTCFANKQAYGFRLNFTDTLGLEDVEQATIRIDPTGLDLGYRWDRATGQFRELAGSDPLDLATIVSTATDATNDTVDTFGLNFKVIFDFNFPKENLLAIKATVNTTLSGSRFAVFSNVFRVENDLEVLGIPRVYDEEMTLLDEKGWVRGGELLTWTNLSVVYEDSTVNPGTGDFSVGVKGPNDVWYTNSTCDPEDIIVTNLVEHNSSGSALFSLELLDIPGSGEGISGVNITLRIDIAGPPAPQMFYAHADSRYDGNIEVDNDQEIFLTWTSVNDVGGSGIRGYYVEYNNTQPTTPLSNGASITINGEGPSHFYLRARDNAGNWGTISNTSITVDMSPVSFSYPLPSPDSWVNNSLVSCSVHILDGNGGGVDTDSVQYTTSIDGITNYYSWSGAKVSGSGTNVSADVSVVLEEGANNYIKWRAQDIAGNGYVVSDDLQVRIDTVPPIIKDPTPSQTVWNRDTHVICSITIDDQTSGIAASTVGYRYSTAGTLNYGQWISTPTNSLGTKAYPTAEIEFKPGSNNYIQWKVKDNAGNLAISSNFRVNIDSEAPSFADLTPNSTYVNRDTRVTCTAMILDPMGSGIDISTVQYAVSTYDNWLTIGIGTKGYGDWTASGIQFQQTGNYQSVTCTVDVTFCQGDTNYIKWRAKDRAGNGYIISGDLRIRTAIPGENFAPIARISSPGHGSSHYMGEAIYFNATMSSDKNEDPLTFFWYSDIDGPLSNNATFYYSGLTEGTHRITLFVDDGVPTHNRSTYVVISVTEQKELAGGGSDGGSGTNDSDGSTNPVDTGDQQLTEDPLFNNSYGVDLKDILIFFIMMGLILAILFNVIAAKREIRTREEDIHRQEETWEQYTKSKSKSERKNCPNCGSELLETDEFCPVCGELFEKGTLSAEAKNVLAEQAVASPPPPSARELYGDMKDPATYDPGEGYEEDIFDDDDIDDDYDDDIDDDYDDNLFDDDYDDDLFDENDELIDDAPDDFTLDDTEEDW